MFLVPGECRSWPSLWASGVVPYRLHRRGPIVLKKLSDQVQECHKRAIESKRKAETTADSSLQADFLEMEKHWLALARSYEFTESLGEFTAANADGPRKFDERVRDNGVDEIFRLQQISASLIEEDNLDSLYARILDAAIEIMSADMGSIQKLYTEPNELRLLTWKGFDSRSANFWERVGLDSASSCGVALSAGRRIVVPDVETCKFLAATADLDASRWSGIRAVQSTPLVSGSGRLLGMVSTHWREPHQPAERELRSLDALARQAADLIERSEVEAALRESEQRSRWLASIIESSEDAIYSRDLDGIITSWNKGAERLYGYPVQEAVGQPITILIPGDRHDEEHAILAQISNGERVGPYETLRRCKHGGSVDISMTASPIKNRHGKVVGISKIARDITERKRNAAQIAVLAREAEHRTRNVLATVQTTVHLSWADTSEGLKRAIEGRIHALANVHALFFQSRWIGAELYSLAQQELAPYCADGDGRARIEGPQLLLQPNTAQIIAVMLHELATNAAKYGALSVTTGHVDFKWSLAAGQRLVLRWRESGGPSVKAPTHQGFGTKMMPRLIRHQLKGEVHLDWCGDGLVCEIALLI
jgi:PAS domain S-box-containing protein